MIDLGKGNKKNIIIIILKKLRKRYSHYS